MLQNHNDVKEELLQKTYFSAQLPANVEERSALLQEKLQEALHLLYEKRYLRHVWLCNQLNEEVLEEAMEEAYPALFQHHRDKEQQRKREADRVHHHLHMVRKYGLSATLTLKEWLATLTHFHWKCAYCQLAPYTVLDHFDPVIVGGDTTKYFSRVRAQLNSLSSSVTAIQCLREAQMHHTVHMA